MPFLIINHAVLVPAYGDPMDEVALQRLLSAFHSMKSFPYLAGRVHQYGSLHCMTMQLPEGVLNPVV